MKDMCNKGIFVYAKCFLEVLVKLWRKFTRSTLMLRLGWWALFDLSEKVGESVMKRNTPKAISPTKLRARIEAFLNSHKSKARSGYRIALGQFSESLGLERTDWHKAMARLLSMNPKDGQSNVAEFRQWLKSQKGCSANATKRTIWRITHILRLAHSEGMARWNSPKLQTAISAERWGVCSARFRKVAEEWFQNLTNRRVSVYTIQSYRSALLRLGTFLAQNPDSLVRS